MFVCGEREKEWEREREGEREYPVVKGYGNKGKVPNKLLATRQKRDTERVERKAEEMLREVERERVCVF